MWSIVDELEIREMQVQDQRVVYIAERGGLGRIAFNQSISMEDVYAQYNK